MKTAKDVYNVGDQNALYPKKVKGSLNYKTFFEKSKTGNPSFDAYAQELANNMQIYEKIDPYKMDSLKLLIYKADSFLKRHTGISYEQFLKQSRSGEFKGKDYEKLRTQEEKDNLFRKKMSLYLSTLEDIEEKGYSIKEILRDLSKVEVPELRNLFQKIKFEESEIEPEDFNRGLLKSILNREGKILETYFKNRDDKSFHYHLEELCDNILDDYEKLTSEEQRIVDVVYHYIYSIRKVFESQSDEIS